MLLVACGGGSQTPETTVTTFEDIFGLLRENGYEVTDLNEQAAVLIGASRGGTVRVNGEEIEMYRYPSRERAEAGAVVAEQFMKAMGTGSSKAYSKGTFVVSLDFFDREKEKWHRHPDAGRIIELLDSHL